MENNEDNSTPLSSKVNEDGLNNVNEFEKQNICNDVVTHEYIDCEVTDIQNSNDGSENKSTPNNEDIIPKVNICETPNDIQQLLKYVNTINMKALQNEKMVDTMMNLINDLTGKFNLFKTTIESLTADLSGRILTTEIDIGRFRDTFKAQIQVNEIQIKINKNKREIDSLKSCNILSNQLNEKI